MSRIRTKFATLTDEQLTLLNVANTKMKEIEDIIETSKQYNPRLYIKALDQMEILSMLVNKAITTDVVSEK